MKTSLISIKNEDVKDNANSNQNIINQIPREEAKSFNKTIGNLTDY